MKLALRSCLLLATAVAAPGHALAQAGSSADAVRLEEIVVTAQRREENLQKVPIAISAVTGRTLANAGIQTVNSLPSMTPGLGVSTQGSGNMLFFLRGVGSNNGGVGDEPSIATYVDGFYIADAPSALLRLNNIERVEVLKGPQGTLYGRNAAGGLISVTTRDPGPDPAAALGVSYANYRNLTADVYGSTPLGENLAANFTALYENQGKGWGRNVTTGDEVNKGHSFAMRGKLKWRPSDAASVTLLGDYNQYHTAIGTTRIVYPGPVTYQTSSGPITFPNVVVAGGGRPVASIYDSNANYGNRARAHNWSAGLRIEHDMEAARLVSLTGFRRNGKLIKFDQDGGPAPLVNANIHQSSQQYSQEFQLLSPESSNIQWIVGAYFFQFNTAYDPIQLFGLGFGAAQRFIYNEQRTRSLAGFAQATVPVGEATNLTVGARYTSDRRREVGRLLNNTTVAGTVNEKVTSNRPTWRVALDHQFAPDMLGYVSYSRGFKSGVFNLISLSPTPVDDEIVDAYETGLKSQFMDQRLRLNLSAFYYGYKNLQLQQYAVGGSFLTNAAKARIYGAEAEAVFAAAQGLNLRAGVSLLNAEYTRFPSAPFEFLTGTVTCPSFGVVIPTGGGPTGGNIVCQGDAKGNKLSRAPAVTATVGLDYSVPTQAGDATFSLNYYYSAKHYWAPDNFVEQKAYSLLNAQVAIDVKSHVRLRLFGANLLNEKYFAAENGGTLGTNGIAAPPRTYGVGVEFKL